MKKDNFNSTDNRSNTQSQDMMSMLRLIKMLGQNKNGNETKSDNEPKSQDTPSEDDASKVTTPTPVHKISRATERTLAKMEEHDARVSRILSSQEIRK